MLPIFITVHESGIPHRVNVALIQWYAKSPTTQETALWQDGTTKYATETPEEIDALIEQAKNAERDYLLAALDDLRIALEGRK